MLDITEYLTRLIQTFATHKHLSITYVCMLAANESLLFKRLTNGGGVTLKKAQRTIIWFSDHWPADLAWPADIPRPTPSPDSPAAQNLNKSQNDSEINPDDPLTKLDARGRIASPNAFVDRLGGIDRASYDQVVRQYADGKPRCHRTPRLHTGAHRVLCALVRAGDRRFVSRQRGAS